VVSRGSGKARAMRPASISQRTWCWITREPFSWLTLTIIAFDELIMRVKCQFLQVLSALFYMIVKNILIIRFSFNLFVFFKGLLPQSKVIMMGRPLKPCFMRHVDWRWRRTGRCLWLTRGIIEFARSTRKVSINRLLFCLLFVVCSLDRSLSGLSVIVQAMCRLWRAVARKASRMGLPQRPASTIHMVCCWLGTGVSSSRTVQRRISPQGDEEEEQQKTR